MNNKFYNIDKPVSVRETFNNTILLLTMIKSEYYYIVSFSRMSGKIEIGFDYESDLHSNITEIITLDFYSDKKYIVLSSQIKNIDNDNISNYSENSEHFSFIDSTLLYRFNIPQDKLIPISINTMNEYVLKAKLDIQNFLENYYKQCVSSR